MPPVALLSALGVLLVAAAAGVTAGDAAAGGGLRVRSQNGWVRGVELRTASGRPFRAFRGLPYAEPPVEELRFKPPVAKAPWPSDHEVFASKEGPPCMQVSHLYLNASGQEDCLYLNVYSHFDASNAPVLVYMHGGSYLEGHGGSRFVDPRFLMEHDLVLVSFNYRLGPFGFLSTEDAAMPGNYGLKDALAVLRWVHREARAFGGDASRVVLAGASAGAAAAHLLALAAPPGLLTGALLASGGALSRWARAPRGARSARRVAPLVGCDPRSPSRALAACLRRADAHLLLRTYDRLRPAAVPPIYAPVVESDDAPEWDPPLITKDPEQLVREGSRVPILMGVTSDESLEWGRNLRVAVQEEAFDADFIDSELGKISPLRGPPDLGARLRAFYLGQDLHFTEGNASAMFSDALFNYPAYRAAALQASSGRAPVYFYVFSFRGRVSETARRGGDVYGVVHGDDLIYVLGRQYPTPAGWPNSTEHRVTALLAAVWAAFAADARPTAPQLRESWIPAAGPAGDFRFLEITGPEPEHKTGAPFAERMAFWERLETLQVSGQIIRIPVAINIVMLLTLSAVIS